MNPLFVAEIKHRSPFGFVTQYNPVTLWDYAVEYGDWIAIHTDPRWGGSYAQLWVARQQTEKPILAKGLHNSAQQILLAKLCGAKAVLTFNYIPPKVLQRWCWSEFSSWEQLRHAAVQRAVWNARDPRTGRSGGRKKFSAVRDAYDGWLCQASQIRKPADVDRRADAFIVGQHLVEFCKHL